LAVEIDAEQRRVEDQRFYSSVLRASRRSGLDRFDDRPARWITIATMSLHLCVLLWPNAGAEAALVDYENRVLGLLASHGARVLQRARTDGKDGAPLEIHILEFPSQSALDDYMNDERRTALAGERDAAIARTEVLRVEMVSDA
jgi:uncharacterized protein (DUF1330 family)